MKIAVMQPYFIPYIGYWQLINAVDTYVIYDDVNYINRGWINRNKILIDGKSHYINVPMIGASQNKKINEISVNNDVKLISKKLKTIEYAYKKAPYYQTVLPVIEKILKCNYTNLALYLENSINVICDYLDIKTKLYRSSSLNKNTKLKGEEKILNICELFNATEYYNAIGGQALYDYNTFKKHNIKLFFLKTESIIYKQLNHKFENNLSIIDIMMFNPIRQIQEFLDEYMIINNETKILEE